MLAAEVGELRAIFVVEISHGCARRIGAAALEQNSLGGKIFIHRLVIVEMVARQVCEYRNVEGHAEHSLLRQRVGRYFHDSVSRAQAKSFVQEPRKFQRLGSSVRRGIDISRHVIFDGPNQRALAPAALKIDSTRNAVVLFPFVPVIPVTAIRSAGRL